MLFLFQNALDRYALVFLGSGGLLRSTFGGSFDKRYFRPLEFQLLH